jgi:hypothetical protein
MIKNILILVLLGSFVLGFWGCAGVQSKDTKSGGSAMLEPQTMFKFADIHVPRGFKLMPQDSYSFESSGVRVGVLKYQGKANIEQVVNFYKEQMPMYNWNVLNIVEYGDRLINLDRENETCIIGLLPKGNNITVTISVGPKSQTTRKSDKPVK